MLEVKLKFENKADIERASLMFQMLYDGMEEYDFTYGGDDQLHEDMAIAQSVKNQLKDMFEEKSRANH